MIKVNGSTSYSELIGDKIFYITENGYKNYRIEIYRRKEIFPSEKIITGSIERAEEYLKEAREKAGVKVPHVLESWKMECEFSPVPLEKILKQKGE